MKRERAVVGLLFCAGVYPLLVFVKQEPALAMMLCACHYRCSPDRAGSGKATCGEGICGCGRGHIQ